MNVTVDPSTIPDTPEKIIILLGVVFGIFLFLSIGFAIYHSLNK